MKGRAREERRQKKTPIFCETQGKKDKAIYEERDEEEERYNTDLFVLGNRAALQMRAFLHNLREAFRRSSEAAVTRATCRVRCLSGNLRGRGGGRSFVVPARKRKKSATKSCFVRQGIRANVSERAVGVTPSIWVSLSRFCAGVHPGDVN